MWLFGHHPSKDFGFEIGDPVPGLQEKSVWTLHKGKKKVFFYYYEEIINKIYHFILIGCQ